MGTDWIATAIASPLAEKAFAALVVFILLAILHQDLKALTRELYEFRQAVDVGTAENNDHMREIRDGFKWLQERLAGRVK